MTAEQLGLDLPARTALGRNAFFLAPSNAVALAMVESWPNWAGGKLVLSGPVGSGKTHLTHVWAALSGAAIVAATDLGRADIPSLAQSHIAVEDIPMIAGDADAQTALFHLHNLVLANGNTLLMTGTGAPTHWGLTLPDLASRIGGTTAATLEAPDDTLLSALLVKLLADRQLTPKPDLIAYLLPRIGRSFSEVGALVARLDAASLALKRPLTRALAASVLDKSDDSAE